MEQELNQRVINELGTLKLQVIDLQVQLKYATIELEQLRASAQEVNRAPVQSPGE